ncbi:MAG: CRISPR-associated helicase Cas3' [Victivallales bacterium]|nr:CRISPR-associated helicase Cas3' [Victivallales bacterium]
MECKLKSHPDRLLATHIKGTLTAGIKIFKNNNLYLKYQNFISAILLLHDLGKASLYFQKYISKTGAVKQQYKCHAEFSALWFYFYAIEKLNYDKKIAVLGFIIIKYHHADLDDFHQMCIGALQENVIKEINRTIKYSELQYIFEDDFFNENNFLNFYDEFTRKGSLKTFRKLKKSLCIDDYIFLNYFFSILLTADKCDAITWKSLPEINNVWQSSFINNYKKNFKPNNNIVTEIRNKAYDEVENNLNNKDRFFSINLPTGAGKTLNALNAALKLKEKTSDIKRIIYCLPFTSVIDQNAEVFEEILRGNKLEFSSDILLKQHHLTDYRYIKGDDENRIYSAQNSEFFIEGWESEFVITTFYQLLYAIFTNKNKNLRKFHNLSNSIIILDEVQSIPHKYWQLINNVFKKIAEVLNIRFILVTATMPLIFSETEEEIKELALSKKDYYNCLSRIRLNTENLNQQMAIDRFKEFILNEINNDREKSRLIILNTIQSSLDVYNYLNKYLKADELVYLSSSIIPKDRLNIISKIKSNPKKKIIVTTQLVEAGVDIDIDVVYRDLAPIDSIFQACGRCNRNNTGNTSEVKLIKLSKNNKNYYSYIYDSVLIDSTQKILLMSDNIEEKEFLEVSLDYYTKVKEYAIGSESDELLSKLNSLLYKKAFEKDEPGEEVFELINKFSVVSAFIELDEEAGEIYKEYCDIIKKEFNDPFEKRITLKEIHKKMAPYIINIPENKAKFSGYDESLGSIWFITKEILSKHYDLKTGFIRDKKNIDYFI